MNRPVLDFKIISVGKIKDKELLKKIEDYSQRIRHDARIDFLEIKDTNPEKECEKLSELIDKENGFIFALSEDGREYGSAEFARKLESMNRRIVFLIGGPFGLNESIKRNSDQVLSLSKMTFPHEIARLLLFEQIYRSISIILNRKYHKE